MIPFFSVGSGWEQILGQHLTWITSGVSGQVWGVNKEEEVVRRRGVSQLSPTGTSWESVIGPKVTQLDVYGDQVWAVDSDQNLYHGTTNCPGITDKVID